MELYYEGVNITKDVQISSAKGRDVSGGRSDSLELVLENAQDWYRWKPQADDRIELVHDGYSTGVLFLNAIAPEGDTYRIFATSAKAAARRKENAAFEGKTLEDIMKLCAAKCEMDHRIFGLDGHTFYSYIQRMDEGSAAFLERILELVDGNTNGLKTKINNEDGRTLVEFVNGDTNALESAINQYDGKEITVKVLYHSDGFSGIGGKFAEGGRATTASIFGEAGPEWAIPEQHTARTAELLNAAREASGFTWPELLSRNGGLNAGEKGTWTLVYSPTIVAGDATGVEQKLKEDKDRLEKWLRDRKLHDDVEVYA